MGWLSDLFGGGQARKDEAAAAALVAMRQEAAANPRELGVVHVAEVQRSSAKGTKAWIFDERTGMRRDAFFWHVHNLIAGQIILGRPSEGYGPHTRRSDVVFFGRQDNSFPAVIRMLPPDTGRRADRYFRRQQGT